MDWHAKNRSEDGVLHIPEDSRAMKRIENMWPKKFQDEPRSLKFGLAIDGVNSHFLLYRFIEINYALHLVVDNEHYIVFHHFHYLNS